MENEYKTTSNQILYQIKRVKEVKAAQERTLVEKAVQQEYIEARYNDLIEHTRIGIDLVNQLCEGDVLTSGWIAESQRLIACIIDAIQEDLDHSSSP